MIETLLSIGFVILFSVLAWAVNPDAESMIWGGVGLVGIGFAYGIPAAIVYHWTLYRSLLRAERLPHRWWISPTAYHGLVPRADRRSVCTWGAIVGSSFLVIVLGIPLTSIGLWQMLVV